MRHCAITKRAQTDKQTDGGGGVGGPLKMTVDVHTVDSVRLTKEIVDT